MPKVPDNGIEIAAWSDGVNNAQPETQLPASALREAENVDLTNAGKPRRRQGYTSVYAGSSIHSLHNDLFLDNGSLKRLNRDYTATDIVTGLSPTRYISYFDNQTETFWTNGETSGRIRNYVNYPLGIPSPSPVPIVSATSTGGLIAGRYQVNFTRISDTGEESGSPSISQLVTVAENGGILVSNIVSGGYKTAVYVSEANGDVLRLHTALESDVTSFSVAGKAKGRTLDTQFMEPMPAGQIIFTWAGRCFVARGNNLHYSPSFRYGLTSPHEHYIPFASRITMALPVENGIFVSADKTYFLSGRDPAQFDFNEVRNGVAVEGVSALVPASTFNIELRGNIAFWADDEGMVIGYPSGVVTAITDERLAIDTYDKGSILVRRESGIESVIMSFMNQTSVTTFGVGDHVTAEVRKRYT